MELNLIYMNFVFNANATVICLEVATATEGLTLSLGEVSAEGNKQSA